MFIDRAKIIVTSGAGGDGMFPSVVRSMFRAEARAAETAAKAVPSLSLQILI